MGPTKNKKQLKEIDETPKNSASKSQSEIPKEKTKVDNKDVPKIILTPEGVHIQ